ncbi:MAG TPA: bifunctional diaminohydroxyphosphoribosylaminopyrimidine deaminase/5-amino-6-(5-phosphoribosylamino)uracil reductase RibD [Sulfurospirillum arcachonense]|nr:bifunctional diaminohydroxyphosphoribosylaminopyrimidine deaminase/5-amino-6-(5-phosphoribosylamino)uracil reductase RibD [Sulfurospirillum arcachonense]HIP44906.1 bifunctional diaminohydroxyphosphoribosylaminopyrimidine deaminase/5-amino-6-(5-phosphoribosylamino)uracil reductase RibD [Sulfurospirillum arcachonense]
MVNSQEYFINLALEKAWAYQGLTYPNPPVGAVITDNQNNFISYGVHKKAGTPHAEVNAIKQAFYNITKDEEILKLESSNEIHDYLHAKHKGIFEDKNIYVTLEPCNHFGKTPPCSQLIAKLGFNRIVIGALDTNRKASGGFEYLKKNGLHVEVLDQYTCKELLEPFSTWQKEPFVFFKLAMSNNGVIDGGVITCKKSHELVHKLRDRCDLLVIGGNTVRIDRPILDARLCDGKAPDILIYSKSKEFDKDIPLFNMPNRKVFIAANFDKVKEYKFVMIEGGEGMLKATKSLTKHYLIFRSPNFKEGNSPQFSHKLKELYSSIVGEDRLTWFKQLDG